MRISICFILYPENLALSPVRILPLVSATLEVQVVCQLASAASQPAGSLQHELTGNILFIQPCEHSGESALIRSLSS